MTDIWSGAILLPDGNTIKDIGFTSPHVASSPALPNAPLRYLTTVDTAKIPLYLAAGPSLDVWTTCEATEQWFESIFLSQPVPPTDAKDDAGQKWWTLARSQSPIGILVQVQDEPEGAQKPRVTEILFYGTIAPPAAKGLPTPPSSSPQPPDAPTDPLPELRVHALPLSSELLYHEAAIERSPTSLALDVEPQFLPPLLDAPHSPGSPKRKRDIFAEATIATKKARGKGGAGVAAAAARGTQSQPPLVHRKSLSIDSANNTSSRPPSRRLSRSPSITFDGRPASRKASETQGKRSNLSHVATVPLQPEEPTTESRNKEALSKVVMAAMRLHGLQQRKKNRSRRASMAPGAEEPQQSTAAEDDEEAAKDEEYKLVYHQTYKGAAFAFRKHISEKALHAQPDRLRDVVEKLLTIFLGDPLAQPSPASEPHNPIATPGGKQRLGIPGTINSHATPFDLPSVVRPVIIRSKTDSHIYTGSPVSRRKTEGNADAPT